MPTKDHKKQREKWRRNKAAYRERQKQTQQEEPSHNPMDVNYW
jgi:hypothetical protein